MNEYAFLQQQQQKIFEFITLNDTAIQHYKTMQLKRAGHEPSTAPYTWDKL